MGAEKQKGRQGRPFLTLKFPPAAIAAGRNRHQKRSVLRIEMILLTRFMVR
ncbi:hypothetical protein EBL_c39820 [Shimwellia blattae DSM 4481 = NBRC 105725]|uniref:Uncharacterized protein n=1 Tax=Shimwellia blattae (strain ATCC 29907 / DSM 4481 / JCM 1650 / NBRC 105725 / CDC 9005-74) TaxID=630626 RepID=I2BEQ2_SHIBC|nr:hypothetical protein EBL_c39820 [Shimwellia blattae DSM 4481 = NBRC 105725]